MGPRILDFRSVGSQAASVLLDTSVFSDPYTHL